MNDGSFAAGAGRDCAPAALMRPHGDRAGLFVLLMCGLDFWAPPQLIR